MSSLSGLSPITSYLSIIKNETGDVAQYVKSTPALRRTVSAFEADSVRIASPADLLAARNHSALQVVLGAYNMSGESNQTGLLRKLLTEDPSASHSLVRQLGSASNLNFVKAMTSRTAISLDFGDPSAAGFTAGGAAASQITVKNLYWSQQNASLTAAAPAQSWSYVLNDGTGAASIAAALTMALQSTGTSDNPVTSSYSVNAGGTIVGTDGAPPVSVTIDSAGNVDARLTLATDSSGKPTRVANVIGVGVPAGASSPTPLAAADASALFARALAATGFNVTALSEPGKSGLAIVNPISNGTLSLSPTSYTSFAATATQSVHTSQNVLPLGTAGLSLKAGQVLLNGGNEIGAIKSVDAVGNVTLSANAAWPVAKGDTISVAIGAGLSHIGAQITASAAADTNTAILALGSAGTQVQAGQTITDGSNVLGVVKSVDASGNVTLQANLAGPVSAGDTLGVIAHVSDTQTPALADSTNVATILANYEINQYETQQGKQTPGMDNALYFTRKMPHITSINALMSDPALLKVVTTNLGIANTFGELPFEAQVSVLTKEVKLSTFSNPSTLHNYAERYLALTAEQNAGGGDGIDPSLAILTGGAAGAGSTGTGSNLFSALYPGSNTGPNGVLAALYA